MDGIYLALLPFLVTIGATSYLIPRAATLGLIEQPGGHRRHHRPTPIVGGIAIFVGLVSGFALLLILNPGAAVSAGNFMLGAGLLAMAGYFDDQRRLGIGLKAIAQVGAAVILCAGGGATVHSMGDLLGLGAIELGWLAWPFTVFAVVGLINAMNMLDGMDGLAGGVGLTIGGVLMAMAYLSGAYAYVAYIAVFAAAVAGFLCFNARTKDRPARTFMGDTGSMLLGYTLAWFVIALSQAPIEAVAPMTVLWVVIVPVMDTFRLILHRASRDRSPFVADNRHLHHLLEKAGWPVNRIVLLACAGTVLAATAAWYLQSVPGGEAMLFYGFLALFAAYVGVTRHFEVTLRRRVVERGRVAAELRRPA